ncbi:hypothetical protein C8R45DRAFT_1192699 [Mycena sanguinolenta]|nr:hypothetical protein C8R45DRAFT_1192699 [Mycena sanguinolenta]
MPRGKQHKNAPAAKPRKCKWCRKHRDGRGFDKHVIFRRKNYLGHREFDRVSKQTPNPNENLTNNFEAPVMPPSPPPMDVDVPAGRVADGEAAMEVELSTEFIGPLLPPAYFKIIPHPHSTGPNQSIIPLGSSLAPRIFSSPDISDSGGDRPWYPFRTRADFEAAEIAVTGGLNSRLTNNLFQGAGGHWTDGRSRITIRNSDHLQELLECARQDGVKVPSISLSICCFLLNVVQNIPVQTRFHLRHIQKYEFKFEYRDPWEWIINLLNDGTLADTAIYNSVWKYYCEGGRTVTHEERVIDEPNTTDTWAKCESELPNPEPYPHCFLPLHFWLDDRLVTKRITMHPFVFRALCQPANIRNASGNGGGALGGYMPKVRDTFDPSDPSSRNAPKTEEFAQYKMEVYQKVLAAVFSSLKSRSWSGEPIRCPDGVVRIFHPGILIDSLDGKEAAYFCACRAAKANFPCPKSLVHKSCLHNITRTFKLRTTPSMKAVVVKAMKSKTNTKKADILKGYGLHGVTHFLWNFRFSDPYAAYSYDTLHSDDLGKWRHHLWPLLLEELENIKQKCAFAENMRRFPRWPGLKHFDEVTTTHFTDGQSFYHILKCVLPCIVQLLPANDALMPWIRAYERCRIMDGTECMPESRLQRLDTFIKDYEYWSGRVSEAYGKDFDFFKQHSLNHLVCDIHDKGTTNHGSTHPGEGFQQEAREAYSRTNRKNAAHQMSRIDETQEARARIRMNINNYDKAVQKTQDSTPVDPQTDAHWAFGAPMPGRLMNSRALEEANSASPFFANLDFRLRQFISDEFPVESIKFEDTIIIRLFKCPYISYESMEDWRGARDIVRCNPCFHQRPRYDCLLLNFTDPGLHFARVRSLLRCYLPSCGKIDLALIREEAKESFFLSMEHGIRGALLAPVSAASDESTHILIDTVDADIFLQADAH